ncbi:hypothetical protein CQA49_08900 [Helicobacter sp. MIT 00-7814]|uniref:autotransporter domain-containing protein n=1 Tax=unclassified Helicobacter TaxID=2593540 RepID=UPI000E1E84AE|nr:MULTISPECIES: autotransporter domain-containing protein [unclassified Helicobacter]RDU52016.1 hypothetical protein CQA49_08900 [Helicobacter sp. MIT 00-7814]RDU52022.1 hypothetical protein CQA37_08995 [Helicobacter sp. MIT 99-10781]
MSRFLKISAVVASVVLSGVNGADITIDDNTNFFTYFTQSGESAILKPTHKNDNIYLHTNPGWYKDTPIQDASGTISYERSFSRVAIEANKLILDDYTHSANFNESSNLGIWPGIGEKAFGFDITTAQGMEVSGSSSVSVTAPSTITGNLSLQGAQKPTLDKDSQGDYIYTSAKISRMIITSDSEYQGDLYINGNLTMTNGILELSDIQRKGNLLKVNGNVNMKDSGIGIYTDSLKKLTANNYVIISGGANTKYNADITDKGVNIVVPYLEVETENLLADKTIRLNSLQPRVGIVVEDLVSYNLKVSGSDLLVESSAKADNSYGKILEVEKNFRQEAKELLEKLKTNEEYQKDFDNAKQQYESELASGNVSTDTQKWYDYTKSRLENTNAGIADLESQITNYDKSIAEYQSAQTNGTSASSAIIGTLAPSLANDENKKQLGAGVLDSLGANKNLELLIVGDSDTIITGVVSALQAQESTQTASAIFSGLTSSNLDNNLLSELVTNAQSLTTTLSDINNNAKSAADSGGGSKNANTSISVSNDMAVGNRIAMLRNPYGNYALDAKLKKARFAMIASDMRYDFGLSDYNHSVWGNVFGGANIIGNNTGALYGFSFGVDRRLTESVILGFYATYANATLKDNTLNQNSHNAQLGVYASLNLTPLWEVGLKAYGQFSPTTQESYTNNLVSTADFNRAYFGLNANIGRVFKFGDSNIKPFVGANYYFTHTPSYTEKNGLAKNVESSLSNALSLELGAELRQYFGGLSYFFATPKIEQYVLNSGSAYTASFVGSSAPSFSIESKNSAKTYGQLIIGGTIGFSDRFSINLGVGVKQILAGKVDAKNETYASGNIGVKYRF